MNNTPHINSTIGPINVALALNISHGDLSKLTQGEKIRLLRLIYSGYLNPSNDNYEEE